MAFRTAQVAEFLGIKSESVVRLARNGTLKAHKHSDGHHWLVEKEDLAYFIVTNDRYAKKFASYEPKSGPYKDSYYILIKEVSKLI